MMTYDAPESAIGPGWGIDDTLTETGGVGCEIYAAASQRVTGHALADCPRIPAAPNQ
jgi:hypothetical protein